ncbi:MAG: hypothetical protein Q8779_02115 [Candidatus Phytoplasma stylosanthis]|uniref:hypothetical protein n=1 Tax=Candidatus Phytoplasma stylosanthis TaxID=2798314 RepID=UPI00293AE73D|nr:hypothetical protein [Candidatus Phytoplasma stylosanthis]MDV3168080.1 hypothetical protein [Candidatus Phytoplasma stylosanthis]MDV3173775.1 hypothetical protein [Candidatus Phytoplasma stylosanthis]MDV3174347.1 hypothetical protein [Candidatus Phytoplasma stylosanthis]
MFNIDYKKKKIFFTFLTTVFFILVSIFLWSDKSILIFEYKFHASDILLSILIFWINYIFVFSNFKKKTGFIKFLFLLESLVLILVSLSFILQPFILKNSEKKLLNIFSKEFTIYYIFIIHIVIKLYIISFYSNNKKSIFSSLEFVFYLITLILSSYYLGHGYKLFSTIRQILSFVFFVISLFYLFYMLKHIHSLIKNNTNNTNKNYNEFL